MLIFFFFQAEDGIRDYGVTGVQTCALPIYYAYRRMLQSIRRSDVALILIDATDRISQVDKKLAQELQRQFKPTVIVVTKWDLVDDSITPEDYLTYITKELRGLDYAPIVFISAVESEGLEDTVAMAFSLKEQSEHRETTGKLKDRKSVV